MKDWKHLEARQKYIAAVVDKLKAEGQTVFTLSDVERILHDAFKVEAADDLKAPFCVLYKDSQIEGPMPYADALQRASQISDAKQCDVSILQGYETIYYIDY